MPKKILAFIIIGAGVFLGLFFFKRSAGLTGQIASSPTPIPTVSATSSNSNQDQNQLAPTKVIKASDLNDINLETGPRAQMIISLGEDILPEQVEELVSFINSQNPYLVEGEALDPHSFEAYQFQKEASLRIFSLRTLSEKLDVDGFAQAVDRILAGSQDEAIKRVALQALDFKRDGKNYFEEMKKAIQEAPLPKAKIP